MLDEFDCTGRATYGRVTIRRLNRVEYNNTIRDLVGVDFKPAADFPNDDVGYGFDNIGDVLSVSPLLLEKYLSAAEAIVEQAIVISRPTQALEGAAGQPPPDVRVPAASDGVAAMFLYGKGQISGQIYVDEGDYTVRAEVFGQQVGDEPVAGGNPGRRRCSQGVRAEGDRWEPGDDRGEGPAQERDARRSAVALPQPLHRAPKGRREEPGSRRARPRRRRPIRSGPSTPTSISACWSSATSRSTAPTTPRLPSCPRPTGGSWPTSPTCAPREAAREIVTRFADRAFRRPVRPEEVERLLKLYDQAEKEGERFENRVRLALEGVLVWPDFLFRVELDPPGAKPGTSYPVSEYELASRLSYFLWSSMPDDELFDLAARGKLRREPRCPGAPDARGPEVGRLRAELRRANG